MCVHFPRRQSCSFYSNEIKRLKTHSYPHSKSILPYGATYRGETYGTDWVSCIQLFYRRAARAGFTCFLSHSVEFVVPRRFNAAPCSVFFTAQTAKSKARIIKPRQRHEERVLQLRYTRLARATFALTALTSDSRLNAGLILPTWRYRWNYILSRERVRLFLPATLRLTSLGKFGRGSLAETRRENLPRDQDGLRAPKVPLVTKAKIVERNGYASAKQLIAAHSPPFTAFSVFRVVIVVIGGGSSRCPGVEYPRLYYGNKLHTPSTAY